MPAYRSIGAVAQGLSLLRVGIFVWAAMGVPAVTAADEGCLRHDYAAALQWLSAVEGAIDQDRSDVRDESSRHIRGCMAFEVDFRSTLRIRTTGGLTQVVTGRGRVMLELAPGLLQAADHQFASRPSMQQASVTWSGVSISGGQCERYDVQPSPPTPFAFWLGVDVAPVPKAALIVVPDGRETHVVRARCFGQTGWPQLQPIFTPAWIAIYSQREGPLLDDYLKIEMTGAAGRAEFARHEIRRTQALPGHQGEVEEVTTIVVTHAPAAR